MGFSLSKGKEPLREAHLSLRNRIGILVNGLFGGRISFLCNGAEDRDTKRSGVERRALEQVHIGEPPLSLM